MVIIIVEKSVKIISIMIVQHLSVKRVLMVHIQILHYLMLFEMLRVVGKIVMKD
jgi:hypothetical protein